MLLRAIFSLQGTCVFDSGAVMNVHQEMTKARSKSTLSVVKTQTEVKGERM